MRFTKATLFALVAAANVNALPHAATEAQVNGVTQANAEVHLTSVNKVALGGILNDILKKVRDALCKFLPFPNITYAY